ncbi:MAG: hypothetical protein LQ342_001708 [Letrouitia transgressa]|nr:MAG: hypothetical protein LQ342_001708 [Letrouitia transgressa]
MVQRLAKGVLPPNTQIQKDAITAMSKGATVFVSHIANAANEITLQTSRKTIAPQHVLDALAACEYGDFLPRVEAELKKFNEIATGKRNEYRRKVKEKESGAGGGGGKGADEGGDDGADVGVGAKDQGRGEEERGEGERAAKRPRREDGDIVKGGNRVVSGAAGVSTTTAAAAAAAQHGAEAKAGAVDEDAERGNQTGDEVDQDAMDEGQNENEEEDEQEEEEDEDEGEDEEQEEEEGSESGASDGDGGGSAPEMEERLRAVQGGFGSGAEDESDESD